MLGAGARVDLDDAGRGGTNDRLAVRRDHDAYWALERGSVCHRGDEVDVTAGDPYAKQGAGDAIGGHCTEVGYEEVAIRTARNPVRLLERVASRKRRRDPRPRVDPEDGSLPPGRLVVAHVESPVRPEDRIVGVHKLGVIGDHPLDSRRRVQAIDL